MALGAGLELGLAELHGQFALGAVLLLHDGGRGVLGLLLRVLEVVAAATCRLTTALHEVILSGHALAHSAARRGLLRTQNDASSVGDHSRELPGVVERATIDQIEFGAVRAFAALVLRVGGSCLLGGHIGLLFGRTDALVHGQVVGCGPLMIDMQRYALDIWWSTGAAGTANILHLDDLLGGLLIGQLLLEAVVSADAEVPVRVDRALGAEAAIGRVLWASRRETRIVRGVRHRTDRLVLGMVDLMVAPLKDVC